MVWTLKIGTWNHYSLVKQLVKLPHCMSTGGNMNHMSRRIGFRQLGSQVSDWGLVLYHSCDIPQFVPSLWESYKLIRSL